MPEEYDLIGEIEDQCAEAARKRFQHYLRHLSFKCESPIERVLLAAFIYEVWHNWDNIYTIWFSLSDQSPETFVGDGSFHAQFPIGVYRADFAIIMWDKEETIYYRAAIECDGHDFHEKTKDQAVRDKRRDRDIQALGFHVLRFTGSEIWSDSARCAAEIMDAVHAANMREPSP